MGITEFGILIKDKEHFGKILDIILKHNSIRTFVYHDGETLDIGEQLLFINILKFVLKKKNTRNVKHYPDGNYLLLYNRGGGIDTHKYIYKELCDIRCASGYICSKIAHPKNWKKYEDYMNEDEIKEIYGNENFIKINMLKCCNITFSNGDFSQYKSICKSLYKNDEKYYEIKENCIKFIKENKDNFENYIYDDFDNYLNKIKYNGHYDEITLNAISKYYNSCIIVYDENNIIMNKYNENIGENINIKYINGLYEYYENI
jgi:hypothetical protein